MSNPSDIAIMLDDSELIRLVASWPKLTEAQRKDAREISEIARVPENITPVLVKRAEAHGLIFEDGTINDFAQKYINGIVASHLKKLK